MPTMTNLEMVTDILNDLDAESITAIGDTVESSQILQILETTFNRMLVERDHPPHMELFNLTETNSSSPSVMSIPAGVTEISWVQMDVRTAEGASDPKRYVEIDYVDPEEFIIRTRVRNNVDTTVEILDNATFSGATELMIRNNRAPEFYTSFDDFYLIFDSYNLAIDTYLLATKSQAYGYKEPSFSTSDSSVQDLNPQSFPLFLSRAKNIAFEVLKQTTNRAETKIERQLTIKDQFNSQRAKTTKRQVDFGRRGHLSRGSTLTNRSS